MFETRKSREEGVEVIHADPGVGVSHGEKRGLLKRRGEHICSVGSNLIFLDVIEWPFEPHALRRVLVVFEEEFERAGGDPDFRVFHRECGFWARPKTFWENCSAVVEQCFVWGGPNYLVVIIKKPVHGGG